MASLMNIASSRKLQTKYLNLLFAVDRAPAACRARLIADASAIVPVAGILAFGRRAT
jgi:hypothetical protein